MDKSTVMSLSDLAKTLNKVIEILMSHDDIIIDDEWSELYNLQSSINYMIDY